jgi:hypothetical protein
MEHISSIILVISSIIQMKKWIWNIQQRTITSSNAQMKCEIEYGTPNLTFGEVFIFCGLRKKRRSKEAPKNRWSMAFDYVLMSFLNQRM